MRAIPDTLVFLYLQSPSIEEDKSQSLAYPPTIRVKREENGSDEEAPPGTVPFGTLPSNSEVSLVFS